MGIDHEPSSTALLIVDVQEGFINDSTRHVIEAVESLQPRYEHIFATRFINAPSSPYRKWIRTSDGRPWSRFGEGSEDVPLAFCASPKAVVIDKTAYTCVNSEFLEQLSNLEITEVHVCGIDTDVCVSICAADLFQNNIRPIVLAEASASHAGVEQHKSALRTLRRIIGAKQVVGGDHIIISD